MNKRNIAIFVLFLVMGSALAMAQETRLTDDRELFMGVPTSSSIIRPNVMILVDVTGSMTQSIYHPYFNRKNDYRKDDQGRTLTINNLSTYFYGSGTGFADTYVPYNSSTNRSMTQEFRVCRNTETNIIVYDVRARVGSVANVTGQPTWRRWNVNSVTGTFVAGQIIEYTGTDGLTHFTRVIQRYSSTRIYVDRNYESTYVDPQLNVYVYVNRHTETRTLSVDLLPLGTACGAGETAYDIKLYAKGNEAVNSEPENDYEYNYLCWLFFRATPEQIAEVNNWSNTGEFTSGVPAGRCRISVAKEAVNQIITDNYDRFNLGLATFSSNSSGAKLKVRISKQNENSPLADFQTAIDSMDAGGSTPLASAMADMWAYFKGTFGTNTGTTASYSTNYDQNDGSQILDDPAILPIKYWCQSNYIILVTDGESYSDQSLASGRFAGSMLSRNPDLSGSWGVADGHDITINSSGTVTNNWYNTSFANYCPNYSCWNSNGSDWLDDIAYMMYHNDLFPNNVDQSGAPYADMPTKQFIETFAIGFSIDNDMLYNTAEYGNTSKGSGAYRSANNYTELMDAIQNFIINITLRDFGFSSFTAPKKVSSALGEGSSFVGYFKPKAGESIWEGHLQSFKLTDTWCPDSDGSGAPSGNECMTYYGSKLACENANPGDTCYRSIKLASTPDWDTATEVVTGRSLYTHNSANLSDPYQILNFTDPGQLPTMRGLFGLPADATGTANAQAIVDKISATVTVDGITSIQMADVFHSDIAYVGPPIPGKIYLKNLNPSECGTDPDTPKNEDLNCFEKLAADQANREKVLYVGTNDGIIHQIGATTGDANSGKEIWGFLPDEVLPTLKTIVIDDEFAFTADGRMQADDIYFRGATKSWKTVLAFGLRDGGNAYYALDITNAPSQPSILWKFKEPTYSGKSWGKPNFGKIRYKSGDEVIDLWVIIVAGGFAFNNENPNHLQGKAIFVLDASTGLPIWTLGFDSNGQADNSSTPEIDTVLDGSYSTGVRYLTAKPEFNFCIPSSLVPIDRDSDGYMDTIYFGNVAGHMFKTNIAAVDPNDWKSYLLFKTAATSSASAQVTGVSGTQVTLSGVSGAFTENKSVVAANISGSSHAMGIVNGVNSATSLTIAYTPGSGPSFKVGDIIVASTVEPIFLSPAVFFDPCFNLWLAFGTGDRLRSRTNPTSGKFTAFRDGTTKVSSVTVQKTDISLSDLVPLAWSGDTLAATSIKVTDKWGWYFTFPQSSNYEKMFDPEPLVLPGMNMIPHIFFNTYQPSTIISGEDCNAPEEGNMKFYDVKMNYCGDGKVAATRESGRIAGGGMFQGSDFILYEGTGNVASIPPLQEIKPIKLLYTGGLLFWKEKKR